MLSRPDAGNAPAGVPSSTPAALGRYLLGVLAGAVQLDARLSEKYMLSGASGHEEIVASVRRVVGETNVFETDAEKAFRDRVRNAWIGEGLAHALLVVRKPRRDRLPYRARRREL